MAFSDATVEASADFSRFDREFPAELRNAVNRATRTVTAQFRQAGTQAGRAFADAVTGQFNRITTAARQAGAQAGRAFADAAETFTRNIDVGFGNATESGAELGRRFREAAERFTQRIQVSFAVTPNARTVGRITGERFRAGAMEFTTAIPVTFDASGATAAGALAGRRVRAGAERSTRNIKVDVDRSALSRFTSLFSVFGRFFGVVRAAVAPLLVISALFAAFPVANFIGALLPLVGLLTLLPGAIFTAAAAITVLAVSFERLGQLIKSNLVPAFAGLRDQIARTVTADLGPRLQAVGRNLSGPVRTGALEVARAFNDLLTQITAFLSTRETASAVSVIFGSAARAVQGLADNIAALLPGLRNLAVAVAPVFDEFVRDINEGIGGLGRFLSQASLSGQAFAWAQAARAVLGELIGIVVNLGSIINSVFSAAAQVGGSTVGALNGLLGQFAAFLKSAEGASILNSVFTTLKAITDALAPVFAAVLSALSRIIAVALPGFLPLLDVLSDLAVILVKTLEPILVALAPVFGALRTALAGILAVLGPIIGQVGAVLANILGQLATVLGGILGQLGPVIAELVTALGEALVPVLLTLEPIIGILLEALAPIFPAIAQLIPPVTQLVIALTPLLVVLAEIVVVLVQILTPLIRFLAEGTRFQLLEIVIPLLSALAEGLSFILTPLLDLLGPLSDFGNAVQGFDLGQFIQDIGEGFGKALLTVRDFFRRAGEFFAALPGRIIDFLAELPGRLAQAFQDAFFAALEAIAFGITSIIVFFVQLGQRIGENLLALARSVGAFFVQLWNDPIGTTKAAIDNIVDFVVGIGERIGGFLTGLVTSIGQFFTDAWNAAVNSTVSGVDRIVAFVRSLPERIVAFGGRMLEVGKTLISKLGEGLSNLANIAGDFGQRIIDRIKNFINNAIDAIERGVNRATSKLGININLPHLATGAVLNSPTVALLAESGPEVVIPLSNPARARQLVDQSGLANLVNLEKQSVTNVSVFIGQRELTDIIRVETDQAIASQADALTNGPRFVGA